jgi:hypothetical protein
MKSPELRPVMADVTKRVGEIESLRSVPRGVAVELRPASRRAARERRSPLCRSRTRTRPAERPKPQPLSGRGGRVLFSGLGRSSFKYYVIVFPFAPHCAGNHGDAIVGCTHFGDVFFGVVVFGGDRPDELEVLFVGPILKDVLGCEVLGSHIFVLFVWASLPSDKYSFAHCPNNARTIFAHCPIYFSSPNTKASDR